MGKISMKAVQQQVYNLKGNGGKKLAYVLRPSRYSTIGEKEIIQSCLENSMVPRAYISGAMEALAQCVTNFLLNGHNVVFPNLGTFSLTSTGFAEEDLTKAGLQQFRKLNVRFLPCLALKEKVDGVQVELDGVFDIAGETILKEATDEAPARVQKYYRRVNRTTTVDSEGNEVEDPSGSGTGSTPGGSDTGSTPGSGSTGGEEVYE